MSTGRFVAGTIWNVIRLGFLMLMIVLVLLFILAKGGKTEDGEATAEQATEEQFEVSEGEFGRGWTDLKYRVKYHWAGGRLKYELFIHPFDHRIEALRKKGHELVLLSFVNDERVRVIPPKVPERIEMRNLEPVVAEEEGKRFYTGWIYKSELQKEGAGSDAIASSEMGWLFSDELLTMLRTLRKERLVREARQRQRENQAQPVSTQGAVTRARVAGR